MKKYAVLVSNENGDRPNFEATDVSLEEAVAIASGGGRVDCSPIGRADRSFVAPDGFGLVWSVVTSTKNTK
jgi:hypothetical protein